LISVADVCAGIGVSERYLRELSGRLAEGTDYSTYIRRGSGHRAWRIVAPFGALDTLSKLLRSFMVANTNYRAPSHVYGFVKGRSTLQNAFQHLNRDCVLRIDIAHFFPSISALQIERALLKDGYSIDAAAFVSELTTIRGSLPIGLSTSPHLSNLVIEDTDAQLVIYSESEGLTFTRYVDDLIFSGSGINDMTAEGIRTILRQNNWTVNEAKTAFMRRGNRQYVTGLYVGCADRPRIPRRTKRTMRWILHHIETFGYDEYMSSFNGDACGDYPTVLLGWARYIRSVEPRFGTDLYRRLEMALPSHYGYDEEDEWRGYLDDYGL
jgi:RNA-directed DNA polymerase